MKSILNIAKNRALITFLISILLLGSAAGSNPVNEDVKVDWSPAMTKMEQEAPIFVDRGYDGYVLFSGGNKVYIAFFNTSFQNVSEKSIDLNIGPDIQIEVLHARLINGSFHILVESFVKMNGELKAWKLQLDNSGNVQGNATAVLEFSGAKKRDADLKVSPSTDSTYWIVHPLTTGKYESLPVTVLNRSLETEKSVNLNLSDLQGAISREIDIDNNGDIYALSCLDKPKGKRQAGLPAQEYHVSVFNAQGKPTTHLIKFQPPYGAIEAASMSILPRGDGKVECTGLYAGIGYPGQEAKGIFFVRMDMENGQKEV